VDGVKRRAPGVGDPGAAVPVAVHAAGGADGFCLQSGGRASWAKPDLVAKDLCVAEAGLDFGAAADDPLGEVEVRLDGGVAGAGGAAEDDVVGVRPVGRPLLSERGLDEELLDARVVRYDLLAPGRRDRVVAGPAGNSSAVQGTMSPGGAGSG